jgi:hypothetical protein
MGRFLGIRGQVRKKYLQLDMPDLADSPNPGIETKKNQDFGKGFPGIPTDADPH